MVPTSLLQSTVYALRSIATQEVNQSGESANPIKPFHIFFLTFMWSLLKQLHLALPYRLLPLQRYIFLGPRKNRFE